MNIKTFFLQMVCDTNDRVSSARFINVLVAFITSFIVIWLSIKGTLGVEFFLSYLAYGSGTFGMGKYLDGRNASKESKDSDPSLKPPKE